MMLAQTVPAAPRAKRSCSLPLTGKRLPPSEVEELRAYSFKPIVDQCLEATSVLLPLRDAALKRTSQEARDAADAYVAWCLDKQVLIDSSNITQSEAAEIRQNLAFLVLPGYDDVWCHGFRLGNYVLTALHCVRYNKKPIKLSVRTVDSPQPSLTIEVYPNDGGALKVDDAPNQDFALLRVESGFASPDARELDWLGEPKELDRVIVVQSHVFLRSVLSLGIADDLTPSVRFEHNPACRLIASTPEGYLLHACATEHGTSGVPLFQRGSDGRLRVIGVHSGATEGLDKSPQWKACKNRAENYGVRPSRAKVSAAMGKPAN